MRNKIALMLVLVFSLLACRQLFSPGFFPMHDDLQVARIYQMDKCIKDGQFPCRWVPDMGYGYGYPLFNFYPPLPFYLGEIVHLIGFSYISSVKIIFILGMVVSAIFMYLLASQFWGKLGGLVSATFYIWAPYHAVNLYVRGAMNEYWAMAFFPIIFWAIYKVITEGKRHTILLALSFAGLLLSHNIMSMLFALLMATWAGFLIVWQKKKFSLRLTKDDLVKLKNLAMAVFWGLGLAAFFVFPAFLEKGLVHVETMFMGYFNYLAHFVSLPQLFLSRYWGYGASVWGPEDEMPFQVGFLHWGLAVLIILLFAKKWFKNKDKHIWLVLLFGFIFILASFLAHSRSGLIWKIIAPLQYLQFPWRFLALVVFSLSFTAGGIVSFSKGLKRKIIAGLIVLAVISVNFSYFKPEKQLLINDQEKIFSEKGMQRLYTDAIFDYLPKSAPMPPTSPAENYAIDLSTKDTIEMTGLQKGSDWLRFYTNFDQQREIIIPQYFFPNWKGWIDEKEVSLRFEDDLGRIVVDVPSGEHELYFRLTNTPVRSWANLASLVSWLGLVFVFLRKNGSRS